MDDILPFLWGIARHIDLERASRRTVLSHTVPTPTRKEASCETSAITDAMGGCETTPIVRAMPYAARATTASPLKVALRATRRDASATTTARASARSSFRSRRCSCLPRRSSRCSSSSASARSRARSCSRTKASPWKKPRPRRKSQPPPKPRTTSRSTRSQVTCESSFSCPSSRQAASPPRSPSSCAPWDTTWTSGTCSRGMCRSTRRGPTPRPSWGTRTKAAAASRPSS